jgi:hypothetical protein
MDNQCEIIDKVLNDLFYIWDTFFINLKYYCHVTRKS